MEILKDSNTHPSYGMISFSRYSGGNPYMFGSEINHNGGISLTISQGERKRSLSRDWYMSRKSIVRVDMTYNQFAETIANMNTQGVPCTLRRYNGEKIEECPPQSTEKSEIKNEFKQQMNKVSKLLDECVKLSESQLNSKKPPTKKERADLVHKISQAKMNISENVPFILDSFDENMDDLVLQAKSEVEGFITNKIASYGLKGLKKEILMIEDATTKGGENYERK